MTLENPVLQTILDNPDDDAPRLVWADWQEERGETERAEFLRLERRLSVAPGRPLGALVALPGQP